MTPEWEKLRQQAHGMFPSGPWTAHVIDDPEDDADHNVVIVDETTGHVAEVAWRVDGIESEWGLM